MSGIETRFGSEHDAERIRAAFYGFVEKHAQNTDGIAQLSTEFEPGGSRLRVRLWSDEAMDAFLSGLGVIQPERRRCFE